MPFKQSLQTRTQVGRVDAVHGRARAHNGVEAEDELVWMLFCQARHEVDLGSHSPLAARRGLLDLLDDVLGRPIKVRGVHYTAPALRVNQALDAGILGARFSYLLHVQTLVRG